MQYQNEVEHASQVEVKNLMSEVWEDSLIINLADSLEEASKTQSDLPHLIEIFKVLSKLNARALMAHLFCTLWITQECAIQTLVGVLWDKIEIKSTFRKTLAIEVILGILAECPAVAVSKEKGKAVQFKCKLPYESEIDRGFILPSITKPLEVDSNKGIGYEYYEPSLLLGKSKHDYTLNYAHINRVNSVQYTLDRRLDSLVEPQFNNEPKLKKNGIMESEEEVLERFRGFKHLTESLPKRDALMPKNFYLCHSYDARGRFYPKAYEFNYQGIAYLKALINFSHKEIIEGEW